MENQIARQLRIGVIRGGNIVFERTYPSPRDVTFGTSPRADIVIPEMSGVPRKRKLFSLTSVGVFRRRVIGYALVARSGMRGALVEGGCRTEIADSLGINSRRRIPFSIHTQGKVVVGETDIVFQMVQPPKKPIHQGA